MTEKCDEDSENGTEGEKEEDLSAGGEGAEGAREELVEGARVAFTRHGIYKKRGGGLDEMEELRGVRALEGRMGVKEGKWRA